MGALRKRWTDEEVAILHRRRGDDPADIAKELGRTRRQVTTRICRERDEGEAFLRVVEFCAPRPPAFVLREREIRSSIPPASTSAMICGDPKPGYTAEDNKRRKLGVQDALEIAGLYSGKPSQIIALAWMYGIPTATVQKVISGLWFEQLLPEGMR